MSSPINAIGTSAGIAPIRTPALAGEQGAAGAAGFEKVLSEAIHRVETFRLNSEQSVDRFLSGEGEDLHKVALATQQAELAFELFLQVKNKVVQAYQEVMRMQV
jgi:flagellar hook-basal body complex protein FliE